MCMWVSSFLPFNANDVLGDVEGRWLSAYVVMVAGGISRWRSCAHVILVFRVWLLILRVGVGIQSVVHFDARGQPSQELPQLVLELACHHSRMLVAELVRGQAVPCKVLALVVPKDLCGPASEP